MHISNLSSYTGFISIVIKRNTPLYMPQFEAELFVYSMSFNETIHSG